MNEHRWNALMATLQLPSSRDDYLQLRRAYNERHRAYHGERHVVHCLGQFDECRGLAHQPAEVELALWFLSAFHRPYRHDNKARSAGWARRFLRQAGADEDRLCRVGNMILATVGNHHEIAGDVALVRDIDLSIFGVEPSAFLAYENAVRREYHRVPLFLYRHKRGERLRTLLERPRLYHSSWFHERCEARARDNLRAALVMLRPSC